MLASAQLLHHSHATLPALDPRPCTQLPYKKHQQRPAILVKAFSSGEAPARWGPGPPSS